jgi:hypothetical protein
MKRTCVARVWLVPGLLLFAVLVCLSVTQVLASSARPVAPGSAGWTTEIDSYGGEFIVSAQVTPTLTPEAYFPITFRNYWFSLWAQELFQDYSGNWPWSSKSEPFSYGYLTDGDGQKVYHIGMDDEGDLGFVTGPMWVAENFEYSAWFRRGMLEQPKYYYDECGILVSPAPIDDPYHPVGSNVISFGIQYKYGSGVRSSYIISRWDALNMNNRAVLYIAEEGHELTDEAKFWNWFTISRVGDTLSFHLRRSEGETFTGGMTSPFTHTDATLPDTLYVGFYAYHSKDDQGSYRLEFQYDTVTTYSERY